MLTSSVASSVRATSMVTRSTTTAAHRTRRFHLACARARSSDGCRADLAHCAASSVTARCPPWNGPLDGVAGQRSDRTPRLFPLRPLSPAYPVRNAVHLSRLWRTVCLRAGRGPPCDRTHRGTTGSPGTQRARFPGGDRALATTSGRHHGQAIRIDSFEVDDYLILGPPPGSVEARRRILATPCPWTPKTCPALRSARGRLVRFGGRVDDQRLVRSAKTGEGHRYFAAGGTRFLRADLRPASCICAGQSPNLVAEADGNRTRLGAFAP